jgi:hypothetical protein
MPIQESMYFSMVLDPAKYGVFILTTAILLLEPMFALLFASIALQSNHQILDRLLEYLYVALECCLLNLIVGLLP